MWVVRDLSQMQEYVIVLQLQYNYCSFIAVVSVVALIKSVGCHFNILQVNNVAETGGDKGGMCWRQITAKNLTQVNSIYICGPLLHSK